MVALWNRADHYIFMLWFVLSSSFPRLISAAADWTSAILPHMVWYWCEFKMQVWNLLQAARWKHRTQKSRQKSPSGHHRTTSSGYILATKAHIDNRKKNLLSSNMSSICLHMVNFGPLAAESVYQFGHPYKIQQRLRLGSVTAGQSSVSDSQTLRRWTEGATYVRQGDHHVGPHF